MDQSQLISSALVPHYRRRWNMTFHGGKRQSSVRVSSILWVPDFEACLYPCVWCSVSLTRGVPGLHRGLWRMIFSCFATKAFLHVTKETHPNGGGLGWIIQHLQSISAPPPLISTPLWTTESAGSSWECWQFPVRYTLRPRGNMRGCGSMDFCEFAT